jgi:hypothetical protein
MFAFAGKRGCGSSSKIGHDADSKQPQSDDKGKKPDSISAPRVKV